MKVEALYKIGDKVKVKGCSEPMLITGFILGANDCIEEYEIVPAENLRCCTESAIECLESEREPTKTHREIIQAMLDDGWVAVPCIVSDINENCGSMSYDFIYGFAEADFPALGSNSNWKYAIPFDPRTENVIIGYVDGNLIFNQSIEVK